MSFTYPIRDDAGDVIGVWTNRFNWNVTLDVLAAVRDRAHAGGAESVELFLVAKDGTVLASPHPDDVLSLNLAEAPTVAKALEADASGYGEAKDVDGKGPDSLVGYFHSQGFSLYPGVEWSLFASQAKSEALREASSLAWLTLYLAIGAIVLITIAAMVFARRITGPIRRVRDALNTASLGDVSTQVTIRRGDEIGEMADSYRQTQAYMTEMGGVADRIATGDLTVEVEPKSERDVLGTAFERMVGNLRAIVGELAETSGTLSASSEELAATADETGRAVGEIAHAVGDVASGAERQARMADETRQAISEASEAAGLARSVTEEGVAAAIEASGAMDEVRDSAQSVTDAVRALGDRSEQIGGIVSTITSIAEQTNLLALNAAIEAARAGEQGRGFAVVAEEVRKLAEESQQAASSISSLISEMQAETQRTVSVVEDGARRSEDGGAIVERTREAFERIGGVVGEMTGLIDRISTAAGEVAAVSEQTSAATQQVSASTEQTSASTEQVAASAQDLASSAESLSRVVARFRTDN